MKYYNIRQLDSTDCAAACLATVSFYYGKEITITKLRDICGTDIKGTSLNGLLLGCQKIGFTTKAVRCTKEQLMKEKITYPFIAHGFTNYGVSHFVVVYKIGRKKVIIADPSKEDKKIRIEDFFDFFDGVCIFLKPESNFICEKAKKGKMFPLFIKLLLPHKKLFIFAILASVFLTVLGILSNYFNQILIDDILPYNLRNQLFIFCIGFLIISIVNIILSAIRQHILLYLSQKIDIPLTLGYFNHIFHLPISFFGKRKTGEILTRFQDASTIKNVMSSIALSVLMDVALTVIVGVILYFMNVKLFVIVIIVTIVDVALVYAFKKPYKEINLRQMEQAAKLNSSVIESLKGIEMVKSNAIEDVRMDKIESEYIDLIKTSFSENMLSNCQGILSSAFSTIANLAIMITGSLLIMDGNMTLGALMTFTSMSSFFMDPVGRLVAMQLEIQEANIAMRRLSELYEIDEEKLGEINEESLDGDILFNDVTFSYGVRKPTLRNISFDIKRGMKIAIVGESGSGKTTLAKLLLGLLSNYEGEIKINGKAIEEIGYANLRRKIAYVSQNIELFSGTIKDNIRCVNKNISDEQIKNVLKMSGCDFVFNLPGGMDTFLDEAGINLSGGERQRLSIARALSKNFDILIVDEATSFLDFLAESRIYKTLFESNINKTMIIIAHRLSTIKSCDKIYLLDKGNILESGTHDFLIENKGMYYKLWMSQVGLDHKKSNDAKESICDEVHYE